MNPLSLAPQEILLRLLAATAIGIALGIDRDLEGKPAGMRTLGLVALGAATITVATVFLSAVQRDEAAISRVLQGVIQGVLTGIAFLGAGAVLHRGEHDGRPGETKGLTTAANVLVVAASGVACGLGAWWAALIAATLAVALLVALHPLERMIERADKRRAKESEEPPR